MSARRLLTARIPLPRQAKLEALQHMERTNMELKGHADRMEAALADCKRKLAEEKAERAHASARLNEMMVRVYPVPPRLSHRALSGEAVPRSDIPPAASTLLTGSTLVL